jgi:predicted RecB family nuclease
MQLALYTDILERMDLSAGRYGFIIDGHGEEITYELDAPRGPRSTLTLWQEYQKTLGLVREIVLAPALTRPAWTLACRACVWQSSCLERLEREDDPTLLPEVARSTRDAIAPRFPTIASLAAADPDELADEARHLDGVGGAMLRRLHDRARLLAHAGARAFRRGEIELPANAVEVFFDVEVNPLRDHCYLHGLLERAKGRKPRYRAFFADDASEEAEESAFAQVWRYLSGVGDAVIYHYGAQERAMWRQLQERYPQVCDADDIEELFAADTTVDLFTAVVRPRTEWPTREYSMRAIAGYLGFSWRHPVPDGAGYVEQYERWLDRRDRTARARILACNEDDCMAIAMILDAIRSLEPQD